MIPLWEKKAIYYYHVGLEADDPLVGDNGIIAGLYKEGFLRNNSSGLVWTVYRNGIERKIHPGEQTQLKEGMFMVMPNGCTIRVVSTAVTGPDSQATSQDDTQATLQDNTQASLQDEPQAAPQDDSKTDLSADVQG